MVRAAGKLSITFCIFIIQGVFCQAQEIESPFNHRILNLRQEDPEYSFLIGGHLYGHSGNQASVYPAPSLLANIDKINSLEARFFMALGDVFREPSYVQIDNFISAFAARLNMPLFNAVGNHDLLSTPRAYRGQFGPPFFHFVCNREMFIVLDTIADYSRISGEQLDFFLRVLGQASRSEKIHNVFIFSHQPIWSEVNPDKLVRTYMDIPNYREKLLPPLTDLARKKSVYWASDDIGGDSKPLNFFLYMDSSAAITYLATGLGDDENDGILQVKVSRTTGITFRPVSLTGQAFMPLTYYDLSHWRKYVAASRETAGFKEKVLRRFRNTYFRYGALVGAFSGVCLLLVILFVLQRRHQHRVNGHAFRRRVSI